MNDTLKKNLYSLFQKDRVVFWYDAKVEFGEDYNDFNLEGVTKLELTGENDFKVKYEILKKNPESKYLLYAKFDEPKYEDNWLLDIQMANDIFRTDACAIYLSELNLPPTFFEVVKAHEGFFKAEKRRNDLMNVQGYNSSPLEMVRAMMALSSGMEYYRVYEFAAKLITEEFCREKKRIYENLETAALLPDVWKEFSDVYGYTGSSIRDFTVSLYEKSYKRSFNLDSNMSNEERMLMSFLKNTLSAGELGVVSDYAYEQLGIEMKISFLSYKELLSFDDYRKIDDFIIKPLVRGIQDGTANLKDVQDAVSGRKDGKWYNQFAPAYDGMAYALKVIEKIRTFDYEMPGYAQAVQNYASSWYEVDYSYRQFCLSLQRGGIDYLYDIKALIDNKYLNSFLRPLNEEWSKKCAVPFLKSGWKNPLMVASQKFFPSYVKKILDEKRTAVVIISDALRYEVGKELASEINSENRFSAVVDFCISNVPSYTQVGMASLLPNSTMTLSPDSEEVMVDGVSSQGSQNRKAILSSYAGGTYPAIVLDINEVLTNMDTTVLRNKIRDYRIVYIYQNVIDERGEKDLVSACVDAIEQLKTVVKKLGSSNVSSMFVTADHGFLFQNQDLSDYDFLAEGSIKGTKITKKYRRFVLGYGLEEIPGVTVVKLCDIGYGNDDDLEAAFPNSILRYRLSGADTHFVHGGLSLEEVVIPVIKITKGRAEDVGYVELEMLSKLSQISTGSLSVKFYQADYVSEKNRGFDAVFGIYAEDGRLVSNEVRKSISSDAVETRDREFQVDFSLNSDSNRYRGRNVYVTVKRVVDNGRTCEIIRTPVLLKKNTVFDELDF